MMKVCALVIERNHLQRYVYSPGHTMRCCTPEMVRPKGAAMPQNRVRCAVRKLNMLNIWVPILEYLSYLSPDFQTVFSIVMGIP